MLKSQEIQLAKEIRFKKFKTESNRWEKKKHQGRSDELEKTGQQCNDLHWAL